MPQNGLQWIVAAKKVISLLKVQEEITVDGTLKRIKKWYVDNSSPVDYQPLEGPAFWICLFAQTEGDKITIKITETLKKELIKLAEKGTGPIGVTNNAKITWQFETIEQDTEEPEPQERHEDEDFELED